MEFESVFPYFRVPAKKWAPTPTNWRKRDLPRALINLASLALIMLDVMDESHTNSVARCCLVLHWDGRCKRRKEERTVCG
jgi:hypothetical protein